VEIGGVHVPVKLTLVDDKSDGATDERAVEDLVKQGRRGLILGTFGSSLVEKGSAVSEKLQVPTSRRPARARRSTSAGSSICSGSSRRSSSSGTR